MPMFDGVCSKCGNLYRDVLAATREELKCCETVMKPVYGGFAYGNAVPVNGGYVEGIGHFDTPEEYKEWKAEHPGTRQLVPGTSAHSEYMDKIKGRKQRNSEQRGFRNPKEFASWNKRTRAMAARGDSGAQKAIAEYGQRRWRR